VLCLVGGVALCAASLGLLSGDYLVFEAPRSLVCGAGAVLGLFGFMMLARDHRASDAIASILLLAIAAGTGWITFYAPPGALERVLPFVPEDVDEALRHLLFGLGAVACVGSAGWALRRLFR
jgi:hypothetical protein